MKSVLDRVSDHVVYDASIMDALRWARANGFAGVQVAIELPHLSPENVGKAERAQIATYCAKNALRITLHAPDDSTSLFVASPSLVKGIFEYFEAMFDFAEQIGSPLITFHVGGPPSFGTAPRPGGPATKTVVMYVFGVGCDRSAVCCHAYAYSLIASRLRPHQQSRTRQAGTLSEANHDRSGREFRWTHVRV